MSKVCEEVEVECAEVFTYKKFIWSIPDFKKQKATQSITSPEFYTTNENSWTITMSAKTSASASAIRSFQLTYHRRLLSSYSVWLNVLNAEPMGYILGNKLPYNYNYYSEKTEYQFAILESKISQGTSSNGLLRLSLKIRKDDKNSSKSCSALGLVDQPSSLADRLSPYILNGEFSDIILEIGGVDLKAHKIILAAQSPVFCTMFKQKMKETNENRVIINDINTAVGEQMLEFVYTNDKPSNIDIFARELLAVAHKYQMNNLQLMCENNLKQKITTSDAVKILIVSDLYGTEKFREFVFDFFCKNLAVLQSNEFKKLRSEDAQLAMEVYDQVIKNKFNL